MIQHHRVQGESVRLVTLPRYTRKAFEAWQRFIASDSVFGLDFETSAIPQLEGNRKSFGPALARPSFVVPYGLDPAVYKHGYKAGETRTIKARSIQFGTADEGWVIPVDDPKWRKHVLAFLRDESKRFVSHNAAFDSVRVEFAYGVHLGDRSIDTLPMCNLIFPGRTSPVFGVGLKEMCAWVLNDDLLANAEKALYSRFADLYYAQTARLPKSFVPGESPCRNCKEAPSTPRSGRGFCETCYAAQGDGIDRWVKEWGWDNISLDDPVFLMYAGLDAVYVRRLLPALDAEIRRRKMQRLSRTEQRVKRLCTDSTVRGLRVDLDWTRDVKAEVQAEFDTAVAEVLDRTGLKVRSPKMKGWLAERGVRTRSLDKEHIGPLVDLHGDDPDVGPVLRGIQTYSLNSNLLTNLTTILRHAEGGDGYVHPQINTLQAHTGRMSYVGPAMQTLAKSGLKGERLRGCFVAEPGFVIIGADYDNQEIRLAAAFSNDEMLHRIWRENLNQHEMTTASIFPEFRDKKQDPLMYHKGKTLDFAQQYGAGPRKIAEQLGITEAEARDLWLKWRETYAGLVEWTDRMGRLSSVTNPFGRVIPADPYRKYANGNYMVQSTGRDVLGKAVTRLADRGYGDALWMLVHDECELMVPEDTAERDAEILGECMTMKVKGVPITATGEIIGTRWRGL